MSQYPGLGLGLRFEKHETEGPLYPIGIHDEYPHSCSELLLVREVAMMRIMDRLTDKPDWHRKVFDEEIASRWVEEALALPNNRLWRAIVGDHHGKYDSSEDEDSSKEDDNSEEGDEEKKGDSYDEKKDHSYEEKKNDSYEEDSNSSCSEYSDQSWDDKPLSGILDRPCLEYCIKELRDKASFFKTSGLTPTLDADAMVVKSDTLITSPLQAALRAAFNQLAEDQKDRPDWHPRTDEMVQDLVHPSMFPLVYGHSRVIRDEVVGVANAVDKWSGKGEVISKPSSPVVPRKKRWQSPPPGRSSSIPDKYWSQNYQWLPANVSFVEGGGVRFTSYINNLHPVKYSGIYRTVEQLIEKALPAWDACLAYFEEDEKFGSGRLSPRFDIPDKCDDGFFQNWVGASPKGEATTENKGTGGEWEDDDDDYDEDAKYDKKGHHREPVQPTVPDYFGIDFSVPPSQTLRERYASKGLQIIVKMATVELTPEKPTFPAGGWHVEGQMNEHIVGTAIYYLDSENVTPSYLHFRMQTDGDDFQQTAIVGQGNYGWLERIYGTDLDYGSSCLQNYGDVETKEGRLLAFPNVFQHRVSPFELADPTKPGRRRIIVLWLVDPELRVISTANVPPQQRDWWLDSVFAGMTDLEAAAMPPEVAQIILEKTDNEGEGYLSKAGGERRRALLPTEIMDMVREEVGRGQLLMSVEEASEHREKLMEERSAFSKEAQYNWQHQGYNFCEH